MLPMQEVLLKKSPRAGAGLVTRQWHHGNTGSFNNITSHTASAANITNMDYNVNYQQRLAMLTPRESEIAELLAWGASKKEIPDLLTIRIGQSPISVHTVENITTSIYSKLQIQKVSELCTIYFCSRFHISMDLSPLKRKLGIIILLALLIPELCSASAEMIRPQRLQRSVTRTVRISRKTSKENIYGIEC